MRGSCTLARCVNLPHSAGSIVFGRGEALGRIVRIPCATAVAVLAFLLPTAGALGAMQCASWSEAPLVPTDKARCAELDKLVRGPKAQLDQYERSLAEYLSKLCHRGKTRRRRASRCPTAP